MGARGWLLSDGEDVVVDVRPHWRYLGAPVLALAVAIVGGGFAAFDSAPVWAGWAALAGLVVAAAWLIGRYLRWATTSLIVTTNRIADRSGVLARRCGEIPLAAVANIEYRQSFFERLIGAGDVVIESAGRDGQEVFANLPDPRRIHSEIHRHMELARQPPASFGLAAAPSSIPDQIERLDQLRRRGVISDAEFESKKVQLLDRI
ncbi:MAG: PH domain-containing protein [Solirubrobacteraceae bacterium]